MGKDRSGFTPKAMSKAMKAKGLQKLKWYCQMCQKQCRDESGFQDHCKSQTHQRNIEQFASNSEKYLQDFSRQFQDSLVEILKVRFGSREVLINTVYQEYIKDRDHVHMTATRWTTLNEFAAHLGKEGICRVRAEGESFLVSYIDRNVMELQRRAHEAEDLQRLEEQRMLAKAEKQMTEALEQKKRSVPTALTVHPFGPGNWTVGRTTPSEEQASSGPNPASPSDRPKLAFALKKTISKKPDISSVRKGWKAQVKGSVQHQDAGEMNKPSEIQPEPTMENHQDPVSNFASAIQIQPLAFGVSYQTRTPGWLYNNAVVKIISEQVDDRFRNQKAVVERVLCDDRDSAEVRILPFSKQRGVSPNNSVDCTKVIIRDFEVQTVIPPPGRRVIIVQGLYRNCTGTLLAVVPDQSTTRVQLDNGIECEVGYSECSKLYEG